MSASAKGLDGINYFLMDRLRGTLVWIFTPSPMHSAVDAITLLLNGRPNGPYHAYTRRNAMEINFSFLRIRLKLS